MTVKDQKAGITKPYTFAKRVNNNTLKIEYKDHSTAWRLHSTDVVTIDKNGTITLDSGGWRTLTTKERINQYSTLKVTQVKGLWYVDTPQGKVDFYDGMKFNGAGWLKSKPKLTINPDKINSGRDMQRTIGAVAMMGELFGKTKKEKNDWKARMLKAGLQNSGLIMPEDWDTLSEAEKEKRLNGAINILTDKKQ